MGRHSQGSCRPEDLLAHSRCVVNVAVSYVESLSLAIKEHICSLVSQQSWGDGNACAHSPTTVRAVVAPYEPYVRPPMLEIFVRRMVCDLLDGDPEDSNNKASSDTVLEMHGPSYGCPRRLRLPHVIGLPPTSPPTLYCISTSNPSNYHSATSSVA